MTNSAIEAKHMWKKIKKSLFDIEEGSATTKSTNDVPHYRSDRFFYRSSLVNQNGKGKKNGWYFLLRGGESHGPFKSREIAQEALDEVIEEFKETGYTGRE
ncbi:hypothetical protein MNBD_GAMMA17-851 [hydrothermal vent metagenome]|uniref:DUF6316 domain-containing protein n=1 Tax=hydrothermal vent metagenome TaxID=652676 RepID=A0A3B1A8I6_9ZZZZ